MAKIDRVLQSIDDFNKKDPHGREFPYAEKLTAWVLNLNPNPSEALRIASRGQHIGRWTILRSAYPMDRGGYLRWREELKRFHAETVAEIMAQENYAKPEIDKVRRIILKKDFRADADAQTIEDALCLVFLESQFEELRQKTLDPKMVDILRKTWKKMSGQAKAAALAMDLPEHQKKLITEALAT